MEQILSQSDVNALLSAVEGGQVEQEEQEVFLEGDVAPFDLTSQDRIIRGRLANLEILNDRFSRVFRVSLSNSLRKMVEVSVESTGLMKFSEFLSYLPVPSCINLLKMPPLKGTSLISIEVKLLYGLLDLFFGGTSYFTPHAKVEGRDFTVIELLLIKKILDIFLYDIKQIWEPVFAIYPEYIRTEINPQFVVVVPQTDVVINSSFEVEVEQLRGKINFIIPYSMVEPIKQKLTGGVQSEQIETDDTWQKRLAVHIFDMHSNLIAQLGTSNITIEEFLTMQKGDIIQLDKYADQPLELMVEGSLKAIGQPMIYKNNLALKVTGLVNWDPLISSS